ncbi:MAG: TetR/AcrR family transcriptional regulator [Spirochaetae bacterium HGW-Spirochaetae-9]|nr:MAG: TetR/AcrR family transcriptional regulator [Spirochaetae bacterium HGW-Spirochaetae-9]
MSVSVEHDKRKEEILDKALDVFVMEGYKDTTFQKIAERCGITRTILYLYFDNKKEIFSSCIKRFMGGLESEIRHIAEGKGTKSADKLVAIGDLVVKLCAEESKLLSIVLDYLLKLKLAGGDPDERVRRRTVRMRHILAMIIIEGKKRGEFPPDISGKATSELFYALIEAAVFRITVLGQKDASRLSDALRLLASNMRRAP